MCGGVIIYILVQFIYIGLSIYADVLLGMWSLSYVVQCSPSEWAKVACFCGVAVNIVTSVKRYWYIVSSTDQERGKLVNHHIILAVLTLGLYIPLNVYTYRDITQAECASQSFLHIKEGMHTFFIISSSCASFLECLNSYKSRGSRRRLSRYSSRRTRLMLFSMPDIRRVSPIPSQASFPLIPTFDVYTYTEHREETSCSICIQKLIAGDQVTTLECSHVFHGSCISQWVTVNPSCPLCRSKLAPKDSVALEIQEV